MGAWVEWFKVYFQSVQTYNFVDANSDFSCKIYWYLYRIMCTFTVWVLVTISLERVVAVCKPHQLKNICTRNALFVFIFLVFIVNILLHTSDLIFLRVSKEIRCSPQKHYVDLWVYCTSTDDDETSNWISDSIDMGVQIILPIILMFISNISIIYVLYRMQRKRKAMTTVNFTTVIHAKRVKQMSICLISATFAHMILSMPQIIRNVSSMLNLMDTRDRLLWCTLKNCFTYINQSINFILYCMNASKVRSEVVAMVKCHNSERRVAPCTCNDNNNEKPTGTSNAALFLNSRRTETNIATLTSNTY